LKFLNLKSRNCRKPQALREESPAYHLHTAVIDAQSVVPQHRERIFLVGFKERRTFEFPEFPAVGPKLESILETDVPDKYAINN